MIANLQHLASTGYTVCMPDFFRNHTASELGDLNPEKIGAFVKEHYAPWLKHFDRITSLIFLTNQR